MSDQEKQLSTPLPKKVKQGEFLEKGILLDTTLSEQFQVEWADAVFLCVGKVEKKEKPKPAPSGPKINVVKTAAYLAAGPIGTALYDLTAKKEKPAGGGSVMLDTFFLFDLYISGSQQPFRFDSVGTSFKKFLKEETGYSSDINFINFVKKCYPFVREVPNSGVSLLVEKGKNAVQIFPTRDEFAWFSYQKFTKRS